MPFALAVGGYLLILFLSIYATSCPLYHVQGAPAKAAWSAATSPLTAGNSTFSASASLACAMIGPLTMVFQDESSASRLLWDPGIWPNTSRRLWDPGHVNTTMAIASRRGSQLAPVFDPMPTMLPQVDQLSSWWCRPRLNRLCGVFSSTTHPFLLRPMPTTTSMDKASVEPVHMFLAPPATTSLFHYSHPVLSQPTVPNIQ